MEFGVHPLQSIMNKKILENFKKRKSIYDIENYSNLKIRRNKHNIEKDENSSSKSNKKENFDITKYYIEESYYWNKSLIISFDYNKFGKLKIFENFICIKEIVDHSEKIIDVFFNKRLNIFATTSFDGSICVYFLPNKLISIIRHPEKRYYDKVYVSANPFPTIVAYEKKNSLLRSYSISGLLIKEKKIMLEDENKNEKENNNEIDENKDKKDNKDKKKKEKEKKEKEKKEKEKKEKERKENKNKENKNKDYENKENEDQGLYIINPLFDFYGGNFKDRIIVYNKKIIIKYSIPFFKEVRSLLNIK